MFESEIKAGAERLDEEMPGWELTIEVGDLKMESCHTCVLGQVFLDKVVGYWHSPYEYGLYKLYLRDEVPDYGFDIPEWARRAIHDAPIGKSEQLRQMFFDRLGDEWGEFIKERLDKGIDLS